MLTQIRLPARRVLKSDAIASLERRNDVRWANLGYRRPDFQGFWTALRSARGTGTMSPIASSQNPWKSGHMGPYLRSPALEGWNFSQAFLNNHQTKDVL